MHGTTITPVNPWRWQEAQDWSWGMRVSHARRTLYCAGQVSTDANGRVLPPGDLRAQVAQALDNLEAVLAERGYALRDVVRIDYYTTDADALTANWDLVAERLGTAGCRAGGMLLGVRRLAVPGLLVELQAIAAR